jgi:L-iditol 2-dehydrogenase
LRVKAAVIRGKGLVELREVPTPSIGSRELLVRMKVCGVCGTDLEKVHGEHITPPVLGHEVAGVVERIGPEANGFNVGDRVTVHHHISCRRCYYCKNGLETLCEEYPKSNLDPCGFAEAFRVPESLVKGGTVYKLPESVSFEEGSQVEPVACCIRALNKVGLKTATVCAVFGVGPVGLAHVQLLKCFGATQLYGIDVIKNRREYAIKQGADDAFDPVTEDIPTELLQRTEGRGVDLAIVATANPKAIVSAVDSIRKGGTVLLFGVPARGSLMTLDASKVFLREMKFQTSYSTSETEMRMALELIAHERVRPAEIITDRFPLSKMDEAIRRADQGMESAKVVMEN